MSNVKPIHVRNRMIWALDNSHDIVVARMVEVAIEGGCPTWLAPQVEHWRVWASIADMAFAIPSEWGETEWTFCEQLVREARVRAVHHGDVFPRDLEAWTVLPGERVSAGFLRYPRIPIAAITDMSDALIDMLNGNLGPDPQGGWWCVGVPGGRQVIKRRTEADENQGTMTGP
jgi:hypothetical protein